jgi:hypothetical protein
MPSEPHTHTDWKQTCWQSAKLALFVCVQGERNRVCYSAGTQTGSEDCSCTVHDKIGVLALVFAFFFLFMVLCCNCRLLRKT